MGGFSQQLPFVVDSYAIVHEGKLCGRLQIAVPEHASFQEVEARGSEGEFKSLPLAWFAAGVDLRWILSVDRGCLPVGVAWVVVGIQDLDFVYAKQEQPAVGSSQSASLYFFRRGPFEV